MRGSGADARSSVLLGVDMTSHRERQAG